MDPYAEVLGKPLDTRMMEDIKEHDHPTGSQPHKAMFLVVVEDLEGQNVDVANEMRSILKIVSSYRLISKVDLYLSFRTKPKALTAQLIYSVTTIWVFRLLIRPWLFLEDLVVFIIY